MMTDIHKSDKLFALVKPYNPDIHIDAEFKQIGSPLYSLDTQRRMHRVFSKNGQFAFELLFLIVVQIFVMLLKTVGKGNL